MAKKTVDVGHYISPSLSELLRTTYLTTYPQTTAIAFTLGLEI